MLIAAAASIRHDDYAIRWPKAYQFQARLMLTPATAEPSDYFADFRHAACAERRDDAATLAFADDAAAFMPTPPIADDFALADDVFLSIFSPPYYEPPLWLSFMPIFAATPLRFSLIRHADFLHADATIFCRRRHYFTPLFIYVADIASPAICLSLRRAVLRAAGAMAPFSLPPGALLPPSAPCRYGGAASRRATLCYYARRACCDVFATFTRRKPRAARCCCAPPRTLRQRRRYDRRH